jgi:ubiquinone/menaquinone biosynthesis C-methylase UbiE
MTVADPKERFSNRVADYVRYRPGYPSAVRDILRAECLLKSGHVIADIGSGTGFLSEVFLKNGNRVFGVEPNEAMRQAGEEYLAEYDNFVSINGSAEATTLEHASVHFVVCGQAFHWFDQDAARREFQRILRAEGWVVVIWNERLSDTTPFLREYESLIRKFNTDYSKVNENYPRVEQMKHFFGANEFHSYEVPNFQDFDFDGIAGRLRSSSYMPTPDQATFQPMMDELRRIVDTHNQDGRVRLEYTTRIHLGQLKVQAP